MRSDSCVKVMPYLQMKFLAKKTIQNVTSDKCTGFWTNKTVKRESKTQLAQSIFFSLVWFHLSSVWFNLISIKPLVRKVFFSSETFFLHLSGNISWWQKLSLRFSLIILISDWFTFWGAGDLGTTGTPNVVDHGGVAVSIKHLGKQFVNDKK